MAVVTHHTDDGMTVIPIPLSGVNCDDNLGGNSLDSEECFAYEMRFQQLLQSLGASSVFLSSNGLHGEPRAEEPGENAV